MTETNVILKVQTFSLSDPLITVELVMDRRHQAIDIADKLNDIAKAKKENTTIRRFAFFKKNAFIFTATKCIGVHVHRLNKSLDQPSYYSFWNVSTGINSNI